jgi:hypothetical protein
MPFNLPVPSNKKEVAAFFEKPEPGQRRGRLAFIIDATGSRQPSWDLAMKLQGEMFAAAVKFGALDLQIVYFRGMAASDSGECQSSRWSCSERELINFMSRIDCRTGETQIQRALLRVEHEHRQRPIDACAYVGDCCEEEPSALYDVAQRLDVPMFVFGENADPHATPIFQELARITGGAYAPFDSGSAAQLRELLRAVATYAAGGLAALKALRGEAATKLLTQMGSGKDGGQQPPSS